MSKSFKSFTFWLCLCMVWVNLVLLNISVQLHSNGLMALNLVSMACSAVGAGINWYLDKKGAGR